jgi:bifunctional DNA-binding transcriptional regulator/antitoxin component of YhaV-PrlF toxin-antitoxin module
MVKTRISSKGQTTIPIQFRDRWKTKELVWTELPDGSVQVRPAPDIMSLRGSAASAQKRLKNEMEIARAAWEPMTLNDRPRQ